MAEIRQNIATKEWVIISTERARRPQEFVRLERTPTADRPERSVFCPFCPGNEEQPPAEQMRIPAEGPWDVRVVLNKYPALHLGDGGYERHFDGVYRWLPGIGRHEVIVESRQHNTCLGLVSPAEAARVIAVLQARAIEFARIPYVEHVICFENHGPQAGTSLDHPHAQIVGMPVVPHQIRVRMEEARRYFDDTGRCVFCQMWRDEVAAGERLITENEYFVAIIPYAAFSPFHTWIIPRRHGSDFLKATPDEVNALGAILRDVLGRLYVGLRDPDYNYMIRSAPLHDPGLDYLHWYVTIVPQVTRTAGFEMGSGMFINTALPEESAAFLRGVEPF
ncbi:MAG: DUF4931 domain-containing protein [Chloroflexi bacterium]|nr:DUF4931 domain-containing protein [Chloroflexota bacterium]